jgi:hypothetical protein
MTEHDLQNFAYHVSILAGVQENEPREYGLSPIPGLHLQVKIEPCNNKELGPQWDTIWIDGRSYGNRHGGIKEFTRRFYDALEKNAIGLPNPGFEG